jgi:hypothetical protein
MEIEREREREREKRERNRERERERENKRERERWRERERARERVNMKMPKYLLRQHSACLTAPSYATMHAACCTILLCCGLITYVYTGKGKCS